MVGGTRAGNSLGAQMGAGENLKAALRLPIGHDGQMEAVRGMSMERGRRI